MTPHRPDRRARKSARQDFTSSSETPRTPVLAVSEDSPLIIDLWTALVTRASISLQIAESAQVAINALKTGHIEGVVLDLRMGGLRAFELLQLFTERQPPPRILLLSSGDALAVDHMLRALGQRMLVRGGENVSEICEAVGLALMTPEPPAGISPAALTVLLANERATCTINFDGAFKGSALFLSEGEIADVRTPRASGEEAAMELFAAGALKFSISGGCQLPQGNKHLPLREILARTIARRSNSTSPSSSHAGAQASAIPKEKRMALENLLQQLKDVKGYKASGIMHFTGEMLAADSVDPHINLAMVGATFNDIFRSAHDASKKIGLEACRETTIVTPKGIIVMACSGVDSKAHVHLIGILAADGNHSLMKMQIGKLINDVVGALA